VLEFIDVHRDFFDALVVREGSCRNCMCIFG
jgi:hypothetical protein